MLGSKCINHFYYFSSLVYVSTDFGLVVIDPDRLEVKDTYFIVENAGTLKVNRLVAWNGKFWAATSQGVYSASTNDPLLISYERWSREQFFTDPAAECRGYSTVNPLVGFGKVGGNDILWMNSGSGWVEVDRPFDETLGVSIGFQKIAAFSSNAIQKYRFAGREVRTCKQLPFWWHSKSCRCIPLEQCWLLPMNSMV